VGKEEEEEANNRNSDDDGISFSSPLTSFTDEDSDREEKLSEFPALPQILSPGPAPISGEGKVSVKGTPGTLARDSITVPSSVLINSPLTKSSVTFSNSARLNFLLEDGRRLEKIWRLFPPRFLLEPKGEGADADVDGEEIPTLFFPFFNRKERKKKFRLELWSSTGAATNGGGGVGGT